MLRAALLIAALLLPATVYAAEDIATQRPGPESTAPNTAVAEPASPPCSDVRPHFPSCGISKRDVRKAKALYLEMEKLLHKQKYEEALDKLSAVRAISPRDVFFITAERILKQHAAAAQVRLGDKSLHAGDPPAAMAAFRKALQLDPENTYAAERLHDALPPREPGPVLGADTGEVRLKPLPGTRSFEFRGPSQMALERFAELYGITTVADAGFAPRNVRIKLDDVDWETGSRLLLQVSKALMVPLSETQVLLATDTEENRRDLVRVSLRTFYIQGETSPQALNDLTNALRTLFELRYIVSNPAKGTITIRAPQATMEAIARLLDDLSDDRPEVVIEAQVFQVSASFTRDLGASVPTEFTVFNVPTEVRKLVSSGSFQEILNALGASGQSASASSILAGLLASSSTSPLAQPFGTFGGGITLTGVTIPATSLHASDTNSLVRTVDQMLLRSRHGSAATMKIGQRYPIATTVYSAVNVNSSILARLGLTGATSAASIPSPQFSYEDLGLVLKATPHVHGKLISLEYELTLRAVLATQPNGPPALTNRETRGTISTEDGEPVVIAGLVGKGEIEAINGIPLLSAIPGLGRAFSVESKQKTSDDLLIVLTPHIVYDRRAGGLYIPMPTKVPK